MVDLAKVVFVGGDARFGSVKIRCTQIAQRLRCRYVCNAKNVAELPLDAKLFVFVKSTLRLEDVSQAHVVWDVLDVLPPSGVTHLTSTQHALRMYQLTGYVIPHHHANDGLFVDDSTLAGWIGSQCWAPNDLQRVRHVQIATDQFDVEELREAYRRVGILLNLRRGCAGDDVHLALNSGIKLINAIGFGLPSISLDEPAYREIAPDCTLFTTEKTWVEDLTRLQDDADLRESLRSTCRQRAPEFHIDAIAERYRALFDVL